jgi:peroxiredoxin
MTTHSPSPENPTPPARRFSPAAALLLIFPLFGLLIAAVVLISSATSAPSPVPAAVTLPAMPTPQNLADTPVIDFELPLLDGGSARLTDYAGRIVFLNFWATWCEPCKRELPAFQNFMAEQAALGDQGAVVLAVNIGESSDVVRAFLVQQNISGLPVLLDENQAVADSYGVFNIPVTFVIDGTGIVRYPKYGEMRPEDLQGFLDFLSAPPSEPESAAPPTT